MWRQYAAYWSHYVAPSGGITRRHASDERSEEGGGGITNTVGVGGGDAFTLGKTHLR